MWYTSARGFDSWNVFDTIIVLGSWIMPIIGGSMGSLLTMLRLLRLLRVLKLVKSLPQLAVIVDALIMGFSSIGFIGLILLVFFYFFAIVGVEFFGGFATDAVTSGYGGGGALAIEGQLGELLELHHCSQAVEKGCSFATLKGN